MLDVDQGGGSVLGEAAQRLTQQAVPKPLLKEQRGWGGPSFSPLARQALAPLLLPRKSRLDIHELRRTITLPRRTPCNAPGGASFFLASARLILGTPHDPVTCIQHQRGTQPRLRGI